MRIKLKRVYDPIDKSDGMRLLVERLWPRGMTKEAAVIDQWMKEVAPSPALRQWFAHDPEKWPEFQRRYARELAANKDAIAQLRAHCAKGPVTFVYSAKDKKQNSAALLKAFLERASKAAKE